MKKVLYLIEDFRKEVSGPILYDFDVATSANPIPRAILTLHLYTLTSGGILEYREEKRISSTSLTGDNKLSDLIRDETNNFEAWAVAEFHAVPGRYE